MSPLLDLARSEPATALAVAGALLALLAWLGWRRPTWLFLLALASLAIRPQLLWGGPAIGYEWGLHQTLLVFALAANALHYGLRRTVNWPILALLATFGLSLAFGNLHPKLTSPFMLMSLALLALPFVFTQVVLEPGSRRAYGLVIMLTPLLSTAVGALFYVMGVAPVVDVWDGEYRFNGATGNPAVFATLALAGFVAGVHEWTRPGRPYAGYIASVNMTLLLLSGTRMAIVAAVMFVAVYAWTSSLLRDRWRQSRRQALLGIGLVAVVAIVYMPVLYTRMFHGGTIQLSVRDKIWPFYFEEFMLSPLFGRGLGAGFIAAADWLPWPRKTPHNEYLHMLVSGGIVGSIAFAAGCICWYRRLYEVASPNDRAFLGASVAALATFAITDDVLVFSSALAVYAYIGMILTLPAPVASMAWAHRSVSGEGLSVSAGSDG